MPYIVPEVVTRPPLQPIQYEIWQKAAQIVKYYRDNFKGLNRELTDKQWGEYYYQLSTLKGMEIYYLIEDKKSLRGLIMKLFYYIQKLTATPGA